MNSPLYIDADKIKSEALRLGFSACGIAKADLVDETTWLRYQAALRQGKHATMHYLENHAEKRRDPRLLVEGTRSIISVALNYTPERLLDDTQYQFAWYAYGKDYHEVVRAMLNELLALLRAQYGDALEGRAFCDTAPVLERYWAMRAGLGWLGKHSQLIVPELGSSLFLGELFINAETHYDEPYQKSGCGGCSRCLSACPTQAIEAESALDARKCLSYLTIEHRGEIPEEYGQKLGNSIYGCDRCLQACPHQQKAKPTSLALLQPSAEFLSMTKEDWHTLTPLRYQQLFKGSAVKRAKFEGLVRNIRLVSPQE